jgi:hypothetical protein
MKPTQLRRSLVLDVNDFVIGMHKYAALVLARMNGLPVDDTATINVKVITYHPIREEDCDGPIHDSIAFPSIDAVKLNHHGTLNVVVLRDVKSDETRWYIVKITDTPEDATIEQFVLCADSAEATLEFGGTEGYRVV